MAAEDVPSWEIIWNEMEGERIHRIVYGERSRYLALTDMELKEESRAIRNHILRLILDENFGD